MSAPLVPDQARAQGPTLEIVAPAIGRPFYRAITSLDALALIETPPAGAEGGSNSWQRWRRRELNPRPQSRVKWRLRA